MASWFGMIKEKNTQGNGIIICKTDLVFIYGTTQIRKRNILEIDILVNGKMGKEMDMVNFFIVMEIFMKVIGKIIKRKALEFYISKIEQNI